MLRRHYSGVLEALSEDVEIAVAFESGRGDAAALAGLGSPGRIRAVGKVKPGAGRVETAATAARRLADVLRYAHEDFDGGAWLRRRAVDEAPQGVARVARALFAARLARVAIRPLVAFDRALPAPAWAHALIERERPDAVVVAPLIWWGSPQVDVLKAAAARGLPTAAWIPSWDNLSTKGLVRFAPDRVFVWNALQVEELERYHRISSARAVVTGAQTFDRWFGGEPPVERRESFCARHGLDPARALIVYVGSSKHIAPDELAFFDRWLAAVRDSDEPAIRDASVLVRPHPAAAGSVESWVAAGVGERPGVVLVRPDISASFDEAVDADYRDAFVHAAAVVGINTSSMVEAAIFGAPVCAPLLPELASRQEGTPHFRMLQRAGGGLLHLAASLDEHVHELARLAQDRVRPDPRSERFVEAFVRPGGRDLDSTTVFVEAMRELLSAPASAAVKSR
jgi:hypothetical protein